MSFLQIAKTPVTLARFQLAQLQLVVLRASLHLHLPKAVSKDKSKVL